MQARWKSVGCRIHHSVHGRASPFRGVGTLVAGCEFQRGLIVVRRSCHLYGYNPPKTRSARRTVELLPERVHILRALQPLHVAPDTLVFTTTGWKPSNRRRSRRTGTSASGLSGSGHAGSTARNAYVSTACGLSATSQWGREPDRRRTRDHFGGESRESATVGPKVRSGPGSQPRLAARQVDLKSLLGPLFTWHDTWLPS